MYFFFRETVREQLRLLRITGMEGGDMFLHIPPTRVAAITIFLLTSEFYYSKVLAFMLNTPKTSLFPV